MYHKKICEVKKMVSSWNLLRGGVDRCWKLWGLSVEMISCTISERTWQSGRCLFSQKNRNIIYPDLPSGNLTYGESLKITISSRCIIYKLAIFNMLTQGLISKKCFRKKTEKKAAWVRPQPPHAIEILRPVGSLSRRVGPLHLFFKSSFWGTTTDAWVI